MMLSASALQDIESAIRYHEESEGQPTIAMRQEHWRYVLIVVDGTWRQAKEMYKVQNMKKTILQHQVS